MAWIKGLFGVAPAELRHGTHIDIAGCRLTYEADMPGSDVMNAAGPEPCASNSRLHGDMQLGVRPIAGHSVDVH